MRDYSKDFAEWRKWRDEKGLPKLLAAPCVPKRKSCSTSVSPQTNRVDLQNSQKQNFALGEITATPNRWRNSFAPLTGYCHRSTRPGHAVGAGSARTAKYNISSTCDAIIPNYAELVELSHTPNLCSYGFKYGLTVQEVEKRMNAEDQQLKLF